MYLFIRHKRSMLITTIFLHHFFGLLTYTNPSTWIRAKQWVRALLLWGLFKPSVFYTHRTTQKFIFIIIIIPMITIIIIIIVILPHIYPLFCNKPIRDKLQKRRVILYCLITHLLLFKTVGNKKKSFGLKCITSSHIFCALSWSGTYPRVYGSLRTASLHISSVLRWSAIYSRVSGPFLVFHISFWF